MKKSGIIIWLPLTAVFFISTAFISLQSSSNNNLVPEDGFAIPEDVNQIFEKSCFGCHNLESSNDKAKKKFMIDELSGLSKAKLVAALGNIGEVLEENEMPPEKFLAKYPDKALTDDEAKRLKDWAEETVNELMK
jgi:hypothetical protein